MGPQKIFTQELFELSESLGQELSPDLFSFLKKSKFPWECLGKALTSFVQECVNRVPKEQRLKGKISPSAHLENKDQIVVCEGAVIEPFAYVEGPCWIGPKAVVRHGAYIRGSVFADKESVLGHTSEFKGSILLPKSKAAHFAYVGDSILGLNCNLGAGTKLANLRFDHGEVILPTSEGRLSTGLKKFGAILGNHAQTGCNSVTNPGTILLKNASLKPCQNGRYIIGT